MAYNKRNTMYKTRTAEKPQQQSTAPTNRSMAVSTAKGGGTANRGTSTQQTANVDAGMSWYPKAKNQSGTVNTATNLLRSVAQQTSLPTSQSDLWSAATAAANLPASNIPTTAQAISNTINSTTNRDLWNIVQQMKNNSQLWHTSDEETQKQLALTNEELAKNFPGAYKDKNGVWRYNGGNLFDLQYQEPIVQPEAFAYTPAAEDPELARQYQAVLDAFNQVSNRPAFSYDPKTDPLYMQYADSYTRSGQRAMTDVLGQLSARTGGMASSYAGAMAQQTYNNYMADLANKIPELYQTAYNMYTDEYNRDRQAMLDRYNMYTDALGQYNTDRNFAYNMYRDNVGDQQWNLQQQYNADRDLISDRNADREWNWKVSTDARDYQHGLERESVSDSWHEKEYADQMAAQQEANRQAATSLLMEMAQAGGIPSQAMLDAAGMTMQQYQAMVNQYNKQFRAMHPNYV